MFRSGYELLTGLTNILILIVSLYSFIRLKRLNYNKYWLSFYMFLIVGSLFGFIIHSFNTDITAVLPFTGGTILVILSVILTLIGGLIPSRKAAKQDPVTALRTE